MTVSFDQQRQNMIESQVRTNDVSDLALINAIAALPRENFVSGEDAKFAYAELEVQSRTGGKLLKMRDFSKLAQAAKINPGEKVLVIGGASLYSAYVFKLLDCEVSIFDEVDVEIAQIRSVKGDILTLDGIEDNSQDVIFVEGGVEYVPQSWLSKLANNGRLAVIEYESSIGVAKIFVKTNNSTSYRTLFEAKPPKLAKISRKPQFSL